MAELTKQTFNYQKHGTINGNEVHDKFVYGQTGMCLHVSDVYKLAVIDVDINKKLSKL